jgi:hypothetical protein
MEGKEKLLVSKLDSLLKHVDYRKCKVSIFGVAVNSYFMNQNLVILRTNKFILLVMGILFWTFVI